MLGFRAKLGTQDAMILLQRDILDPPGGAPKNDNRAILGLDLQSAFDKVKHSAILAQVSKLGLGGRSYDYIRSFLTRRTARLEVGGEKLEERTLGSVARGLEKLDSNTKHCIYADDITIWVTGGSDSNIEASLQAAVDTVETALSGTGLRCSPQKSRLLILPPTGRHRKKAAEEAAKNIVVHTSDGKPIPHVPGLRVLGMFVDGVQTNEISEAQRTSQLTRLGSTVVGRRLLARAGLKPPGETQEPTNTIHNGPGDADLVPLRDEVVRRLVVYPLPKNTDPERDLERSGKREAASSKSACSSACTEVWRLTAPQFGGENVCVSWTQQLSAGGSTCCLVYEPSF
ncbi:uncharacterized protein LOC144156194 [Haemaphysalis longicornis]